MRATDRAIGRIEPGNRQANPTGTPKIESLPPLHQGSAFCCEKDVPCGTVAQFKNIVQFALDNEVYLRMMFGEKTANTFYENEYVKAFIQKHNISRTETKAPCELDSLKFVVFNLENSRKAISAIANKDFLRS